MSQLPTFQHLKAGLGSFSLGLRLLELLSVYGQYFIYITGKKKMSRKYHPPVKSMSDFRVGDMIDFNGVLGILVEKFDWSRGTRQAPAFAWRVVAVDPAEPLPKDIYSGHKYGISACNLYNIWKTKIVSRGPEK